MFYIPNRIGQGLIVIWAAGLAAVAVIYVVLNLVADLSYALLDPRVRHG